jgi:proteasome lid subunit RPN8/RPN11
MHAKDPESYPRTARRAFLIDPFALERILREAKERGEVLRGIFHSHPDEDAYFSQEDREAAVPFGDVPSYPQAVHIVMSVREGEVRGAKAFRWDPARKDFLGGDPDVTERT